MRLETVFGLLFSLSFPLAYLGTFRISAKDWPTTTSSLGEAHTQNVNSQNYHTRPVDSALDTSWGAVVSCWEVQYLRGTLS
ncbi:hypothetical protein F4778DRAFT_723594 [Xylariomycetidae sp. FL2044]|nr:hypothetical protein F4778DRAFT_723594 [Xylariomycetidae sp. FL2044]